MLANIAHLQLHLSVAAASMWTKREMVEFKDAIRKEGGDAIIKVCISTQKLRMSIEFYPWISE